MPGALSLARVAAVAYVKDADLTLMTAAPDLFSALCDLLDWGREHTSPRDPNSPHALLIKAADAIPIARMLC